MGGQIPAIDQKDVRPIWLQIEEGVKRLIASGVLAPGELVVSVRDMARELRVNPAIVARAYRRLAAAGILKMGNWGGVYVADISEEVTGRERKRLLREAAVRYADFAAGLGANGNEAVRELRVVIARKLLREGPIRYEVSITRFLDEKKVRLKSAIDMEEEDEWNG